MKITEFGVEMAFVVGAAFALESVLPSSDKALIWSAAIGLIASSLVRLISHTVVSEKWAQVLYRKTMDKLGFGRKDRTVFEIYSVYRTVRALASLVAVAVLGITCIVLDRHAVGFLFLAIGAAQLTEQLIFSVRTKLGLFGCDPEDVAVMLAFIRDRKKDGGFPPTTNIGLLDPYEAMERKREQEKTVQAASEPSGAH